MIYDKLFYMDGSKMTDTTDVVEYVSNGSLWMAIWNDIKTGGTEFYIFGIIVFLWSIRKLIIEFITIMFKKITKRYNSEVHEYTKKDVMSHPIFKDLEFWLTVGIKSVRFNNLPIQFPNIKHTNETEEYVNAKEEIAKDILNIKFESIQSFIKSFINDNDLDYSDLEVLKKYLSTTLLRCNITQQTKMMDLGIPKPFLTKYIVLERLSSDNIINCIETLMDEKSFELSIYSRVYIMFNILDHYLTEIFNNIAHTISVINGDLNGLEYKGKIIGVKSVKILQPPHATYVMVAREYLTKLLHKYHASRVYMLRYYATKENEIAHSCVYEVCNNGITAEISNIQNIIGGDEDVINLLKAGNIIATETNKFNNYMSSNLLNRGCVALTVTPIFENDSLIGSIVIEYTDLSTFEKYIDIKAIDEEMHKASMDVKLYITYPTGYEFQS